MRLSDDQRRLAEENHNLIYWFLSRLGLPVDEWYGVAAIGLVKAVATYDSEKAKLATYACICMHNEIRMVTRKRAVQTVSLNDIAFYGEDGVGVELQDVIQEASETFHCDSDTKIAFLNFVNRQPERVKTMMQLRVSGCTQVEVGQRMGVSQSAVTRTLQRVKQNYITA